MKNELSGTCQKRTGSAFSMGLIVPTEALQITGKLTAWSRPFETQPDNPSELLQAAQAYRERK